MNRRRTRRLLAAAFALSLLLHAILAISVRWQIAPPHEVPQKMSVVHEQVLHVVARPLASAPPSAPPSTPLPQAVRHAVAVPLVNARGSGAAPPPPPIAASTPAPVRTTTPAGCSKADEPAAVAVEPPAPEIPVQARARGVSGITSVTVKLDERGAVVDAVLADSSGDPGLDQTALEMAKFAQYTPALHLCKALASTYAFKVRFAAW